MDVFQQLATAIQREHEQGELPNYLVAPLQQVVADAEQYQHQQELVGKLTEQLGDLDPYSDCGCFGEGYTVADLITTLKKLGIEVDGAATPPTCSLT